MRAITKAAQKYRKLDDELMKKQSAALRKLRECVRGPFHPGVVKKDNGDDTYHVTFDDGGFELKVPQSGIKAAGGGGGMMSPEGD